VVYFAALANKSKRTEEECSGYISYSTSFGKKCPHPKSIFRPAFVCVCANSKNGAQWGGSQSAKSQFLYTLIYIFAAYTHTHKCSCVSCSAGIAVFISLPAAAI